MKSRSEIGKQANKIHLCLIAVVFTFSAIAQSMATNITTNTNIESVCLESPKRCLKVVEVAMEKVSPESRRWFDLLQYRYDALFNLQKTVQLCTEVNQWVEREDVPIPFHVTALIYYAKCTYNSDDMQSSIDYAKRAEQKLTVLQSTFPSPMRLIELANIQMLTRQYHKAFQLLMNLAAQYEHNQNPHFMMELFGNLGHLTSKMGKINESLDYWLKTKEWSFKFGNKQQIATVSYNLAKIQSQLGDYSAAENNLLIAIEMANIAGDIAKQAEAKLFLVAIYLEQKASCKALTIWKTIAIHHLPPHNHESLELIKTLLLSSRCLPTH